MSSAELVFNGIKCEKCGYLGWSKEMTKYYSLLDDRIVYECKDQSQCFDMLQVIDDFCDTNN